MPLSTEFSEGGHAVLLLASGIFTGKDLISCKEYILDAANSGMPIKYCFVDLSNIAQFAVNKNDIYNAAEVDKLIDQQIGKVQIAVLAPSDVAFGMARMWQSYVELLGWDVAIFRNRDESLAWLAANGHVYHFSESV